ncbi:MAG: response regulator [Gammaproteobacteria bacterium]|nr:response regulator [Gammaproteobacteria bacterium]MDH5692672.1 response regulator [Gammaproteobacteria bacterium]
MQKLLVIDDDKIGHKVIDRDLLGLFEVSHAYSGEDGIAVAQEVLPDVILLDVEMPGMNGYEVCDALKHLPAISDTPIIFLSSHSSLRERMQGYESGGSDYIVKPFVREDLVAKINVLIKYRQEQLRLRLKMEEAQKTANIAMSGSSELALAMAFVERSHNASDFESLANYFLKVTDKFGLNTVVLITIDDTDHWFSSAGSVSPLENQLVTMLRNEKRFYDFGCRTQINYPNISLLIKNMPLDNMERYGRIKDILPAMLSTANTRVIAISSEQAVKNQTKELNLAFSSIQHLFTEIIESMKETQDKSVKVLRQMLTELATELPSMSLEEDQENMLLDKVEEAVKKSTRLSDSGDNIKEAFDMVLLKINTLAEKQNKLVNNMLSPNRNIDDDQNDLDDVASVELF